MEHMLIAEQHTVPYPHVIVRGDAPLNGVFASTSDEPAVLYFADEQVAVGAVAHNALRDALMLAGAWDELSWDEIEAGLARIGHAYGAAESLDR
jgi:hypothetical protein